MLRPDDLVTIDFPGRRCSAGWSGDASGQADVLLQRHGRLAVGEVVIHPIFEGHAHKRQAVERSGPDDIDAGRRVEPDLHRARVVTLHLLGRQARGLGGDFEDDRRRDSDRPRC